MVTGAAALYKCSVEITWPQPEYIAMHTDAGMTDLLGQTVSSLLGADHWHVMPDPVLVAEDFAFLSGRPRQHHYTFSSNSVLKSMLLDPKNLGL